MATTITVKLLIDTKGHKVLYAESGKEFVDFLFTIMKLPVGTVISLVRKDKMLGSLGTLYDSIENIGDEYTLPNCNKESLLKPDALIRNGDASLLLANDQKVANKKLFRCSTIKCRSKYKCVTHNNLSDNCPTCNGNMNTEVVYVAPKATSAGYSGDGRGYVKDVVRYMVMDNLEVKPMCTISCIAMLNKFNVSEAGLLEVKEVHLGMEEGLKLLKASLESNSVLTSVFLRKKEE